MNQKGLGYILVILILLAGVGIAVYLTQFTQVFKPKAAEIGQPPIGYFDFTDGKTAVGWAMDPDTNNPIPVHFYIDGKFAGETMTNGPRQDIGKHAFVWSIPQQTKGPHTISTVALGVNPDGSLNGSQRELGNSPKTFGVDLKELPLHYSGVSETGRQGYHTLFVYKPPQPNGGTFNFAGLKGGITISGNSSHDSVALFTLFNYPDGQCPDTGRLEPEVLGPGLKTFDYWKTNLVLKLNAPGSFTQPIDYIFPFSVPLTGCTILAFSGGEPAHGDPITMTSSLTLLYDTEAPVSPAPYFINLGDEYCNFVPPNTGCMLNATSITPDQAYALYKPFNEKVRLLSLTGNMGALTINYPGFTVGYPTGPWSAPSDYYIYPQCNAHPTGVPAAIPSNNTFAYGPAVSLAQVPPNAIPLFSTVMTGNGSSGGGSDGHKAVVKYFSNPPIINPGDCLVHLQKYITNGGLSAENQVFALVQPIPPAPPSSSPSPSPLPSPAAKPGDTDGDNDVDIFDYNTVVTDFGKKNDSQTKADLDNDDDVDIFDYNIVVTNFGK